MSATGTTSSLARVASVRAVRHAPPRHRHRAHDDVGRRGGRFHRLRQQRAGADPRRGAPRRSPQVCERQHDLGSWSAATSVAGTLPRSVEQRVLVLLHRIRRGPPHPHRMAGCRERVQPMTPRDAAGGRRAPSLGSPRSAGRSTLVAADVQDGLGRQPERAEPRGHRPRTRSDAVQRQRRARARPTCRPGSARSGPAAAGPGARRRTRRASDPGPGRPPRQRPVGEQPDLAQEGRRVRGRPGGQASGDGTRGGLAVSCTAAWRPSRPRRTGVRHGLPRIPSPPSSGSAWRPVAPGPVLMTPRSPTRSRPRRRRAPRSARRSGPIRSSPTTSYTGLGPDPTPAWPVASSDGDPRAASRPGSTATPGPPAARCRPASTSFASGTASRASR